MNTTSKLYNPNHELNQISKLDKFHAHKTHKTLSYSEIQKELKMLVKELHAYKTNFRIV